MDKTGLENLIYSRARAVNAQILQKNGELFCLAADERLERLLGVYNRFFKRENRLFVKTEQNGLCREYAARAQRFDLEALRRGPVGRPPQLLCLLPKSGNRKFLWHKNKV